MLEKPGDLAAILSNLQAREVLFIDEIHRMSPVIEEILYPAMEDFELDILIGQGPSARSVTEDIGWYSVWRYIASRYIPGAADCQGDW